MTDPQTGAARVQAEARSAAQDAFQGELESAVLDRMQAAGGNLAQLARFRSFVSSAAGIRSWSLDLWDMAVAGWEAMTINRRITTRVAAAHGFGYWAFQHTGIAGSPNPPNGFLVMHRERDARDAHIGEVTDNPDFSADDGFSSADWNNVWRRGFSGTVNGMEARLQESARNGELQPVLRQLLGPTAALHQQSHEATANQFRILQMCPKLGDPAAAASGFLLSSLSEADRLEVEISLRLYQRFPYRPNGRR